MLFSSSKPCVCVSLQWGLRPLWTENIPPSCNLCDPAVSLPTAIYFFSSLHTPHLPPPSRRQTHTHAHAPTAPVAPPRLLRVEQGDPGPMRQAARGGGEGGGGNQGRTCPGSAFWSSSRQGDRSAVTPALEETAPSSGGGDGPPSFALR